MTENKIKNWIEEDSDSPETGDPVKTFEAKITIGKEMGEDQIKEKAWILYLECKTMREIIGVYKSEEGAVKARHKIQGALSDGKALYYLPIFIIEYDLLP